MRSIIDEARETLDEARVSVERTACTCDVSSACVRAGVRSAFVKWQELLVRQRQVWRHTVNAWCAQVIACVDGAYTCMARQKLSVRRAEVSVVRGERLFVQSAGNWHATPERISTSIFYASNMVLPRRW